MALLAAVAWVAVVGSVWLLVLVSVVEVPVMFQPAPVPVSSSGVVASVLVVVLSVPLSVSAEKASDDGAVRVSEPPVQDEALKVAITPTQLTAGDPVSVSLAVPAARLSRLSPTLPPARSVKAATS